MWHTKQQGVKESESQAVGVDEWIYGFNLLYMENVGLISNTFVGQVLERESQSCKL